MTRAHLASLAVVVVATLGSTGCCGVRHARYVRSGYGCGGPVRAVYVRPAVPPVEVAAPPPSVPAYPQPLVVYANVPRTTIIVINPPAGGPPVVQVVPQAPAAPAPRLQARPQENPSGWFDDE